MYKFIKLKNPKNSHDTTDVAIRVNNESTLPELLQAFEDFLLACGFVIKGDIVIEEDYTKEKEL